MQLIEASVYVYFELMHSVIFNLTDLVIEFIRPSVARTR